MDSTNVSGVGGVRSIGAKSLPMAPDVLPEGDMAPQLLWRSVLQATIDTLLGRSKGQYHITLNRPSGIQDFFAGLPRAATDRGGYNVQVPLAAAFEPVATPATSFTVAYIGPKSSRRDWRITSQRPDTAYPLWRSGVGLLDTTRAGDDFIVLVRDTMRQYHARWLRRSDLDSLPVSLIASLGQGTAGIIDLRADAWQAVRDVLRIPDESGEEPPVILSTADPRIGESYRKEDERVSTNQPDPFSVDPDVLDRGISGHRRTQNALARHLETVGYKPLSHRPGVDPPFDLAWWSGGGLCIAEVKSVTAANQEKQLRLALGQVLRYAHQLRARGHDVRPVIVTEMEPLDRSWQALCDSLGVLIAWPSSFSSALPRGRERS